MIRNGKILRGTVGCGIAGHRDSDIAPLFNDAPSTCSLPDTWASFIGDNCGN
jgi:hypothetical protein